MTFCLVTGGNGYIAASLVSALRTAGRPVRISVREAKREDYVMPVGDISHAEVDWSGALKNVDVVIHCAARVHMMDIQHKIPLSCFRSVNVNGTMMLAHQAVDAGVRRFIFISSVKVNGELTTECPFTADDVPQAEDAYAISKMEAEMGLRELAAKTGMEVVIIRPPLVYGPGVKANFRSMMKWVRSGVPLPLGRINNRRSFVAVDNLVDLVMTCIDHPRAANETFLVSDDEDLSTTELLRRLATAMNLPSRLLPVPSWMLEVGATLLGKKAIAQRLCGSLQLDISKTKELLGWQPRVSVDEALKHTVAALLADHAVPQEFFGRGAG